MIGTEYGLDREYLMKNLYIPWKAWYGDEKYKLIFPEDWTAQIYPMKDAMEISREQIRTAFSNPIGTGTISQLAEGKKTAVIAVDDICRPTPAYDILPEVLSQLKAGGIKKENIKIIIALGAHRALTQDELIKKLGEDVVRHFEVYNHNPVENLVDINTSLSNVPVKINKHFVKSDLKIVVGSVIPHPFAGFSGGAKIVFPGLAGIEAMERSHRAALMGLSGSLGKVKGNRFREQAEKIAKKAGMDIAINVIVNSQRNISGLFVGDVVQSHREAVKFARDVYSTEVPENLDVAVLNAYPKDNELLQAGGAFNFYRSAQERLVKESGTVIIASACSLGLGSHGLFEPGANLYRKPTKKRFLGNRKFIFFSPNISDTDFHSVFWNGYPMYADWQKIIAELSSEYHNDCCVGIFPHATLQLAQKKI